MTENSDKIKKMDSKNFTLFIVLVIVMVAVVTLNLQGHGIVIGEQGRPIIREPFTAEDYSISIEADGIRVSLSDEVLEEYKGNYLSVHAYDSDDAYFAIFKRITGKEIEITVDEIPSFQVTFKENKVANIDKPERADTFYQILKDAINQSRDYGLGRCLLGRQCIQSCPVNAIKLIRDDTKEGKGRIIPEIEYTKCILDGKCANVCPTHLTVLDKTK